MIVYRISKKRFAGQLTGEGARIASGRWNSKGIPMIYTAASISLATLEVLVHFDISLVPKNLILLEIYCPDTLSIETISIEKLLEGWDQFPFPGFCADIGDGWYREMKTPILKVPSAVIRSSKEWNFLINPMHPDFQQVEIIGSQPYVFDRRLISI